jgi:hypothetical protein
MHNLTELVIDKIWRYYWEERKQVFLKDIKNKNHKLLNNVIFSNNLLVFARCFNYLSITHRMSVLTYDN